MEYITILLAVLLGAAFLIEVIMILRYRKTYVYSVKGHEAVLKIRRMTEVLLYVDGVLTEQSSSRFRLLTLHATIDGEEFKVFVTQRALKCEIRATYAGKEIPATVR